MISAFFNPIFPVFAIMLVGIVLSRGGMFDRQAAQAINRFVFFVAVPALLVLLLSQADLANVDVHLLAIYFLAEIIVFFGGAVVARTIFNCAPGEAILLGMASCFVNHVFFVLPIVTILYGEQATSVISAIIAIDTTVIFGGTIVGLEIASHRTEPGWKVFRSFLRNPVLVSIAAGLVINVTGISLHEGFVTFTRFAGAAAAPAALFSLGIILAQSRLFSMDYVAITMTILKVIGHPLVAWLLLISFIEFEPIMRDSALFTAAGPCGAMPFVLALQYNIKADSIGHAIIYSTLASLLTLSILS